jgi:hypothetical protein
MERILPNPGRKTGLPGKVRDCKDCGDNKDEDSGLLFPIL